MQAVTALLSSEGISINYPVASYGILTKKVKNPAPQAAGNLTRRD